MFTVQKSVTESDFVKGDKQKVWGTEVPQRGPGAAPVEVWGQRPQHVEARDNRCLLYTSDAADE